MSAILNSLSAHNLPIFQPILMILVSKFMIHIALLDEAYLWLGLLSPLTVLIQITQFAWQLNDDKDQRLLHKDETPFSEGQIQDFSKRISYV